MRPAGGRFAGEEGEALTVPGLHRAPPCGSLHHIRPHASREHAVRRYDPNKPTAPAPDPDVDPLGLLSSMHELAGRLLDTVARHSCVLLHGILTGGVKLAPADRRRVIARLKKLTGEKRYAAIAVASKRE
jgi:hypothetical protein